jgi:hypothetical protein
MVLLQVDPPRLTLLELEGDAPRTVGVYRKAMRFMPTQTMEVKTRQIQV